MKTNKVILTGDPPWVFKPPRRDALGTWRGGGGRGGWGGRSAPRSPPPPPPLTHAHASPLAFTFPDNRPLTIVGG